MSASTRNFLAKFPSLTKVFVAFLAVVFAVMSGIMPPIDNQKEFKNIIIMIGDLPYKTSAVILKISVKPFVLMVHDPAVIPVAPFFFRKRYRPSPGMIIRHGRRI